MRFPTLQQILFLTLCLANPSAAEPAEITVRVNDPGIAVPCTMHGLFFEDINYGADGGLYAEMIQNRSFEDREHLYAWSEAAREGARGRFSTESEEPLNVNNTHFLRLYVMDPGTQGYGMANSGFDGLVLSKGGRYFFSIHAHRRAGDEAALRILLEDGQSHVLASAEITNVAPAWKKFEATMTSPADATNARLVVLATKAGTVDLDMVSLFPETTFRGRRNGLRGDLAQALADMKPGFLRFPGGCVAEGKDYANAYRWKDTIGDVAERKQNWNIWQDAQSPHYDQSYGLGFFEYFQFCEDIGAEPVPVINCGMTCQARHGIPIPLDELGPWVQDALDLIEFANGPEPSQWGLQRAAMGHPKPFGLKFLAVGNEQWLQGYFDRYDVFYRAIKTKYPGIRIISSSGPLVGDGLWRFAWDKFRTGTPADLVDEHYYVPPQWLLENSDRYAAYDRHGPKIFVGEFAGHDGNRRSNLRCALAEAAYMTGLLRNADIVAMASYAPLLARMGRAQWRPDLIWFDNSSVLLTPNYHVQALFARNRPDVVLPAAVTTPVDAPDPHGMIGVGTWKTRAEYKDIRVVSAEGRTLFECDFARGLDGWKTAGGDWSVVNGALRQSATDENVRAVTGDPSWKDYTLTLRARKLGGEEGFLILFETTNMNAPTWWNLGGWGNTEHGLQGAPAALHVPGSIDTGRWYNIKIELRHGEVMAYLDGKLIHQAERKSIPRLYSVAGRSGGDIVLDVVNVSSQPQETRINLEGASRVADTAQETVLTSASADDENTLGEPPKVAPATRSIAVAGTSFSEIFPPNSLTMIRLKTQR
ncbi:MAG: alpha-L-arabinofuranosidase C-terminal domain-containing protein [Verrucomicrobiota bacterium]|jgi:alpha-L-arabinofuranosidase